MIKANDRLTIIFVFVFIIILVLSGFNDKKPDSEILHRNLLLDENFKVVNDTVYLVPDAIEKMKIIINEK